MSMASESALKQNPGPTGPATAAVCKQHLETVQSQLAELRGRIKRSTWLTAVAGALVLLVLTLYFAYGSYLWAEVTHPEKLADLGQTMVEDNLPGIRQSLEKQIIEAAPGWAAELSKKMVAEIPGGRERLEGFLIVQLDLAFQEADLVTEKEFRKFLGKHRPMMAKRFKELANNPKLANEALEEMVAALESDIDLDLRASAAETLKTIKGANRNWKDMLAGGKLSDEQKLELRAWSLARRLILEQTEPERLQPGLSYYKGPPLPKTLPGKPGAKNPTNTGKRS